MTKPQQGQRLLFVFSSFDLGHSFVIRHPEFVIAVVGVHSCPFVVNMRRYSHRQNLSTLSEINITPLLDLAFVLLIIFMITTPLLESSMNLVIPSSGTKNPPINTSHVQTVSIDRDDAIRFNDQLLDLETLTTQLLALKETNPDIAIVIRPDRELPVQKLIGVMDAVQRAGITKVGIATKTTTNEHE